MKSGEKYGHLTVISKETKKNKHKKYLWKCICDCGKIVSVYSCHVKNGKQKSCGCIHGISSADGEKVCSICKVSKSKLQFSLKNINSNKVRSECKDCINNHVTNRYSRYKSSANSKKLDFRLSLEGFKEITNKKCYYCGNFTKNKDHCGIDRINSSWGYFLQNCLPCCEIHNYMKNDMTKDEFIAECLQVINFHKKELIL